MTRSDAIWLLTGSLALAANPARAQKAPEVGYAFPPGGRAGTTVNVRLGGYDWTPDMQLIVHDPRVRLEATGPISEIKVPPPPYWFGLKAYTPAMPLPRELPARFVLPAGLPPGPIRWSVANAAGASASGAFMVGAGLEYVEEERRREPQALPALPVTVSGRLLKIAEVDRYRFKVAAAGLVTCSLTARALGSGINGVLEVRDGHGALVGDAADPEGRDAAILTFAAVAGEEYTAGVHDLDFRGDFSYTYRLEFRPGPRVVGSIPAAGTPGETRDVTFLGIGIATGAPHPEVIRQRVTFPTTAGPFRFRLDTPHGSASWLLAVDAAPHSEAGVLEAPASITTPVAGILKGRHRFRAREGEALSISVQARSIGSAVDPSLAILGPDGARLAQNDDVSGTPDAGLIFVPPADGEYTALVTDVSGRGQSAQDLYRLVIQASRPDVSLRIPAAFSVPVGETRTLAVTAVRTGGFTGPVMLGLEGLPEGVSARGPLVLPAGASELKISLTAAADAPAHGSLVSITGVARLGDAETRVVATAGSDETAPSRVLLAVTLKAPWKADVVDKDGGHRTPRGATYPAEVTVERTAGYAGPVVLQMAAKQSYHVQGIWGPEFPVGPGERLVRYPCFMPEWLETSRTSRMILTAVGQVRDPRGNVRYLLTEVDGRITMSMEGALMKLAPSGDPEITACPGDILTIRLRLQRSPSLVEPVRLELAVDDDLAGLVALEAEAVGAGQDDLPVRLRTKADPRLSGDREITVRAVALREGRYPVVSQTTLRIRFVATGPR